MVELTLRDGKTIVINCDRIESITSIPETKIALVGDAYFLVQEPADEIVKRIVAFKQRIYKNVQVQFSCTEVPPLIRQQQPD